MNLKTRRAVAMLLLFAALACCFVGCSNIPNDRVIGTCGEYEILYEELRFVTMTYKAELDAQYGDGNAENGTIWDDPDTAEQYRAKLEEYVWNTVKENYSVLQACTELGIHKNVYEGDYVKKNVDEMMAALMADYASNREYKNALEESYMTENLFRFYFAVDEMKYFLYTALEQQKAFTTDEEEFEQWLVDGNCAYVQHFLRYNKEGTDKDINRQLLSEARENLVKGEWTLSECINSLINEDMTNVTPYFLVRHVHDDALVDAAVALRYVGDATEIVETEDAMYVLVLMEEEETEGADGKIETPLSLQLTNLLSSYQWAIVGDRVTEAKKNVVIELNEYGQGIDLLEIQ
jgi:hypothetical protein